MLEPSVHKHTSCPVGLLHLALFMSPINTCVVYSWDYIYPGKVFIVKH